MKNIINKIKNAVCSVINNTLHSVNKGFTLIELLVVVLIIGILAAIALPQYKLAKDKAKVTAVVSAMRVVKDAVMEWKLVHGSYSKNDGTAPTSNELGVSWPSNFQCEEDVPFGEYCYSDYCSCVIDPEGSVFCECGAEPDFNLWMYQPDNSEIWNLQYRGMTICSGANTKGKKICKALGKEINNSGVYQL